MSVSKRCRAAQHIECGLDEAAVDALLPKMDFAYMKVIGPRPPDAAAEPAPAPACRMRGQLWRLWQRRRRRRRRRRRGK